MTIYGREIKPEDLPVIDIGSDSAMHNDLDELDLSHLSTGHIEPEQYQQQPDDGCEGGACKI